MVCVSDSESEGNPEPELGLTPSVSELDSIETDWSQIVLWKLKEPESSKTVMKEIMELISELSGSLVLSEKSSFPTSRVGISSGTVKSSPPKPKILDPRV